MNKITKATIAGAAGVALLLGGAGSFALWNDDATVAGGTVNSGTLTITPVVGSSTWSVANADVLGASQTISSIQSFLAVPGDVLTFQTEVELVAKGTNLEATLTVDEDSLIVDSVAPENAALKTALLSGMKVTATGAGLTSAGKTVAVTGATGAQNVMVSVELTFPKTTTTTEADNAAQSGSVDLTQLSLHLVQN